MAGYKKPCRYCGDLVPSEAKVCPFCAKGNPLGQFRCPKCRIPIAKGWKACSNCGLSLEAECPYCKEMTFLSDYCEHCNKKLTVICPNKKCNSQQPFMGQRCTECNTKLA